MRTFTRQLTAAPIRSITRFAVVLAMAASVALTPGLINGQSISAERGGIMLGIWQPPAPGDLRQLDAVENTIGRDVDIIPWYQAWDSTSNSHFRADKIREVRSRGAIPMITWEPWNTSRGVNQPNFALDRIAAGDHDRYIRSWARGARDVGGQILLRFAHEMNGDWYPWAAGVNGNTASDYVAAWNHVYAIFQEEGATNVEWVWSPNRDYPGATDLRSLYPGDERVDWIAIDGYNFGTEYDWSSWRSFNETFKGTYDIVTGFSNRPVMIGETGSSEAGGDKAAWIREGMSPANLQANFPELRAVIWFNQVGSGNWPISTSQDATRAFAETVKSWGTTAGAPADNEDDRGTATSQQAPSQSLSDLISGIIGGIPTAMSEVAR